jgi:PIN domain nuclease of toxin-antitoxin system
MRLLLDTHVLLWWHDQPARLTGTAYSAINDLGNDVFLSVVNGWEIQIKAQLGKLTLPKPLREILQEEQATNGFRLLPRLVKKLKCAILAEHTVQSSPASHLAFHLDVPHTHQKRAITCVLE